MDRPQSPVGDFSKRAEAQGASGPSSPFAPALDAARRQLACDGPYRPEESSYRIVEDVRRAESPFLTIVMRTQGKRLKAMAQALNALEAQDDDDFEILVCVHNMPSCVDDVLRELRGHTALEGRWGLTEVTGGSPARPLNVASTLARGRYYVVHDDDDLALPNYVSAFRAGAEKYPGNVLYSYVYAQSWLDTEGDPVASGKLETPYCKRANQVDLLFQNSYPDIGVAFPMGVFASSCLSFDETLDVLDDWDFLLRTQNICGLSVLPEPTSIYRLWETGETSHVRNDAEKWLATARKIQQKVDSNYLVLPPGSMSALKRRDTIGAPALYFDDTRGFAETKKLAPVSERLEGEVLTASFDIDVSDYPQISALRFDPSEGGHVVVSAARVLAKTPQGDRSFELDSMEHNGIGVVRPDGTSCVVFLKNDPQLVMTLSEPCMVERVDVEVDVSGEMPDGLVDQAIEALAQRKVSAMREEAAQAQGTKPGLRGLFRRR